MSRKLGPGIRQAIHRGSLVRTWLNREKDRRTGVAQMRAGNDEMRERRKRKKGKKVEKAGMEK
jgi:hypothetical protein